MLRVFSTLGSWRVWITTKSDLVARDVDLLNAVAVRNTVGVMITIPDLNEFLRYSNGYLLSPVLIWKVRE